MDFQHYVLDPPYCHWLWRGVGMTLLITFLTSLASLILGGGIACCRLSPRRHHRAIGAIYVSLFRNLPPLPLLLFLLFALPGLFRQMTGHPFPTGLEFPLLIAGLSLNTSAYLADILGCGVRAVPREHAEAARLLGLTRGDTLLRVIAPQALRIALPAMGTRLVHNLKNSSLALALPLPMGAMEVTGQAGRIAGQTFAWAEPLLFAAGVYLVLGLLLSLTLARFTRAAQRKVEVAL